MGNTAVNETPYPTDGYVQITWDNSDEAANWYQWRVYRKKSADATWTLIHTVSTQAATYEHFDYLAPANVSVDYAVVQATSDDGGQTVNEGAYTPITVTPLSSKYWLIHPDDSTLNLRLEHVTKDDFDEQYEEATMNLIGRGRKVDQGDRWGVQGSLEAQLRHVFGGATASEQRQALQAIKAQQGYVYLRNPFGDVWKVVLANIRFGRVEGVGINEYLDFSVSYSEVA